MGGALRTCTRTGSTPVPPTTILIDDVHDLKLLPSATVMTSQDSEARVFDEQQVIDHIFLLTEHGILSTLQFLLDLHPVPRLLQTTRFVALESSETSRELTVLHVAAARGRASVLFFLLSRPHSFPHLADPCDNMMPLHLAVLFDHPECVEVLCHDVHTDVNDQDAHGDTALHLAVMHGNIRIATQLLCCEPAYSRNHEGNTPLHVAASVASPAVLEVLLDNLRSKGASCGHIDGQVLKAYCRQLLQFGNVHGKKVVDLIEHRLAFDTEDAATWKRCLHTISALCDSPPVINPSPSMWLCRDDTDEDNDAVYDVARSWSPQNERILALTLSGKLSNHSYCPLEYLD